jgi:hypothetical protein
MKHKKKGLPLFLENYNFAVFVIIQTTTCFAKPTIIRCKKRGSGCKSVKKKF